MRRVIRINLVVCALGCPFVADVFVPDVGMAYAEGTTRFTDQTEDHNWFEDGNWSNHVPNNTMHAIIKINKTCEIPASPDAEAKSVTIRGGATLEMQDNSKLVVDENITIKGGATLMMNEDSVLVVADNITGEDGAQLTMNDDSALEVGDEIKLEGDAQMLMVYDADADARFITVEADAELIVQDFSRLTLGEDDPPNTSTVLGLLEIGGPGATDKAYLVIAGDHTIRGAGGEVFTHKNAEVEPPFGEDPTLTLASDCGFGQLGPDCAVLMRGGGRYEVRMVNDAIVQADLPFVCPIRLMLKPKQGSGLWSATEQGELWVMTGVTGSADWLLGNTGSNPAPILLIAECLSDLSGNVVIKAGTVKLEQDFCTTGEIKWDSTTDDSHFEGTAKALFGAATCSGWCSQ